MITKETIEQCEDAKGLYDMALELVVERDRYKQALLLILKEPNGPAFEQEVRWRIMSLLQDEKSHQ